ncbi:cyclin-related 2 [Niveomyces insectorum RCEF 264]|uniref:Cyclin-related 2 n=1 Tax=Niveomyces insectorum RCEF 264 TaxID=1081102 RepID=A0A167WEU8_9HYPO|nr:cyclin-related 2 [Niveomyces insectorum RCEF 264]
MGTTYQPPALASYDDHHHHHHHHHSHHHNPHSSLAHRSTALSSHLLSEAERKRTKLSDAHAALSLPSVLSSSGGTSNTNSIGSGGPDSTFSNRMAGDYNGYGGIRMAPSTAAPTGQELQNQALHQQQRALPNQLSALSSSLSTPTCTASAGTVRKSSFQATPPALQAVSNHNNAASHHPSRLTDTTLRDGPLHGHSLSVSEKDSAAMVMHSLEIPKCIDPRGGSLSDFTAEMTCLFWFEFPLVYQLADNINMIPSNVWIPRICQNAVPNSNFKSWVHRLLATTQVTQNVVLLALLFVYRLKSLNPMVRGKPGSEFRLLTVALMLGNKFLDDNTYTNKTWSDVSCLHVKDIHVMEVEFLSNMRYSLLVSKDEWEEWLVKLAKLRVYYERASPAASSPQVVSSPLHPFMSPVQSPIGTHQAGVLNFGASAGSSAPILEPPTYSPTYTPVYASTSATARQQQQQQQQPWTGAFLGAQATSPPVMAPRPDTKNALGKRTLSYDDPTEPPPKRASRQAPQMSSALPQPPLSTPQTMVPPISTLAAIVPSSGSAFTAGESSEAKAAVTEKGGLRLPPPQLTLNTATTATTTQGQAPVLHTNGYQSAYQAAYQPVATHASLAAQAAHAAQTSQTQNSLALPPPLALGVRAMATVYAANNNNGTGIVAMSSAAATTASIPALTTTAPTTTAGSSYAHQPPLLTTTGPNMMGHASSVLATGGTTPTSFTAPSFGTPTKRMSPLNALTPGAGSVYAAATTSSPLTESFPHMAGGVHTPMSHSPSIYLQQRASPYRPIRNVHMLLNPPPSSSLQEFQTTGPVLIPPTQMYYQPLGRRHDLRSGIVPEFRGMPLNGAMRHGLSLTPIQTLQQQAMQQQVLEHQAVQQQQAMQQHHLQHGQPHYQT